MSHRKLFAKSAPTDDPLWLGLFGDTAQIEPTPKPGKTRRPTTAQRQAEFILARPDLFQQSTQIAQDGSQTTQVNSRLVQHQSDQ